MNKQVLIALLALAPAFAAAADYTTYIGASIGRATTTLSVEGIGSAKENTTGAKIYGGVQVNETFGVEGGYAQLGNMKELAGGLNADMEPKPIYLAITATMPLQKGFSLHAKAGAVRNRTDYSATITSGTERYSTTSNLWTVGASYAINANLSAVAEYESFGNLLRTDDSPSTMQVTMRSKMFSMGLRYTF